ncbi:MAG: MFS transporter [Ktedonobacteraceae bacterium]
MSNNIAKEIKAPAVQTPIPERKAIWPIYALFTGNIVSYIGNTLTLLAVPWFVLLTTNDVTRAGIVGFFSLLSTVVSSALSGVLVERLGYRRISVASDVLSGLTVLLIPLLYHTIGLAFWELLILVFLGGLLTAPGSTARATLLPNLAELAEMRLERANAFENGGLRISAFVGAPLAGILIASIGPSNLLWLDAASFAFSALVIGLFVPAHLPVEERAKTKKEEKTLRKQSYFADLREGLSFMNDAVLLTLLIVFVITNMLDSASSAVVTPAYALRTYHSAVPLGLLFAALGGMGFVGTLLFAAVGHRLPRRLTFSISFLIGGAMRFWILLIPVFPVQLAWFALAGLALGPINPLVFTVIQERMPREKLARIMGIGGAMVMAGMPLGTLASGFIIAWIGLRMTLIIMGVIYLLATLSILMNRQLKKMEKTVA